MMHLIWKRMIALPSPLLRSRIREMPPGEYGLLDEFLYQELH